MLSCLAQMMMNGLNALIAVIPKTVRRMLEEPETPAVPDEIGVIQSKPRTAKITI